MNPKSPLVARREALLAQCAQQRAELAAQLQAVRHSATPISMSESLLAILRQHKLLAIGGTLALAFIKPRRLIAGLEMGLVGWGMWQKFAPTLQKIREHVGKS